MNKQPTFDRLIGNCGMVGNPCNLHTYTAGLIMSRTCKSAVTDSILTWSELYICQDFPLLFIIIMVPYSRPPNHRWRNTSARWERVLIQPMDGRIIQCITLWHEATTLTAICPLQSCQCSHQAYDPGCTFEHWLHNRKQQEHEAACNWMWLYSYHHKQRSTDHIMYGGYMARATCPIYHYV